MSIIVWCHVLHGVYMGGWMGGCATGHVWRPEDTWQERVWVSGIELKKAALAASTFTS